MTKSPARPSFPLLDIVSLDVLDRHEKEILQRLRRTPNGERLFQLDPLSALEHVNVRLGVDAVAGIRLLYPGLGRLPAHLVAGLADPRRVGDFTVHLSALMKRVKR